MVPIRTIVVDDSPWMRGAVVDVLQKIHGCNIVGEGENGLEALELARTLRPDLIVMDVNMPYMGGIEATRLLKEELPDANIVLVTSVPEPQAPAEVRKLGAVAYLPKGAELREELPETIWRLYPDRVRQASQCPG